MRTALDTNILSALWSQEPTAAAISQQLGAALDEGGLTICGVVYAELLANRHLPEGFLDPYLAERAIAVDLKLVDEVWAEAGKRFRVYSERRQRSGGSEPKRLLADFLVGAHALLQADRLMTLDATRYRQDFPELTIISKAAACE